MSNIRFDRVRKVFDGGVVALEEFTLEIPSPRLVVLVGPSGCGKTTLLRLIAGLERPTSGSIMLGSGRLDTLDARERDVAMVFQNYALYPHMSVAENLSFGLRIRKMAKDIIERKVMEVAKSLEIDRLLDRRPAELSGGQRQRVALGRAVIREPRVFLFDEPLSNLDARLRDEMRYHIKRLYQRLGTTMVYVTHDQIEAMTIGELLVVLRDGRMHQVGTPGECYKHPADTFVASFLGSPPMNLLECGYERGGGTLQFGGARLVLREEDAAALDRSGMSRLVVGARAEDLRTGPAPGGSLTLEGRVVLDEPLGHEHLTHIDVQGQEIVFRAAGPPVPDENGRISISVVGERLHFFSKETGQRVDLGVAPRDRIH